MFDLRRKASGQLAGSQASDAREALALKLEQGQSEDANGGLLRKGVNRIYFLPALSGIACAEVKFFA
jgi:hypothetical protein